MMMQIYSCINGSFVTLVTIKYDSYQAIFYQLLTN